MADIAFGPVGGNWNTDALWIGGVKPTAADNALLNNLSAACTIDAAAVCRSIDCTGYTGTLTHATSTTLTIGDGTAGASNIALKFSSGMTYSRNNFASSAVAFVSSSATQQTIESAGKTFGNITFNGAGSSYILVDSMSESSSGATVTLTQGALDINNQTCTWGFFSSSNTNTRSLTLGTSTLNVRGDGTFWDLATTTNLTLSAASSSIVINLASAVTRTFAGGGKTYGTLTYTVAGSAGELDITGSNTFNTLNFSDITNARTLKFTAGTTNTFTTFNVNGTASKLMTIGSITAAGHTLSKSSGTVSCDYLSISRSTATGGATWYAGDNSTNGGNNSGWIFTAVPATSSGGASAGSGGMQTNKSLQNLRNLI